MATNTNAQTFDFETMAVVLYAMAESGVTLGMKHYEMMAKADGTRGKDGFNHQFRKVKARAKELQEQAKNGTLGDGKAAPAKPAANGGGKQAPVKRGELFYVFRGAKSR
jgi:hypothetical protein